MEAAIPEVFGNITGLKRQQHNSVERLYRASFGPAPEVFIPLNLANRMAEIARELNRQIGILVDRRGQVTHVIVGDAHRIFIPDLTRHRAGSGRFRGLRLLHTHLRGEGLNDDLRWLRLDMVYLQSDINGRPEVGIAMLNPEASVEDRARGQFTVLHN